MEVKSLRGRRLLQSETNARILGLIVYRHSAIAIRIGDRTLTVSGEGL